MAFSLNLQAPLSTRSLLAIATRNRIHGEIWSRVHVNRGFNRSFFQICSAVLCCAVSLDRTRARNATGNPITTGISRCGKYLTADPDFSDEKPATINLSDFSTTFSDNGMRKQKRHGNHKLRSQRIGNSIARTSTRAIALIIALMISSPGSAAQAQHSAREISTNLTGFSVPFQINADDSSFIEVQLYLSEDRGKSWQFIGRQNTDSREFPFQARGDGEYWFALKTLSRQRKLLPEGDTQAELKITVDTIKPELSANIKTDAAGRVVCEWDARDANIDADSLRIFYQGAIEGGPEDTIDDRWQEIPFDSIREVANGVFADSIAWWPDTTERALNVRLEIADRAGNVVTAARQVVVPQVSWRHRPSSTIGRGEMLNPGPDGSYPASDYPSSAYPPIDNSQTSSRIENSSESEGYGRVPGERQPPGYSSNMICKDGICLPVGTDSQTEQSAEFAGAPPQFPPGLPPSGQPFNPPQANLPSVNLPQANQFSATRPRVGSPPELLEPPVPATLRITKREKPAHQQQPAWQQPQHLAQRPQLNPPLNPTTNSPGNNNPGLAAPSQGSIAWEGNVHPSPVARQSAVGSTLGPGTIPQFRTSQPESQFDRDRERGLHGGTYQSNPQRGFVEPNQSAQHPQQTPDGMFVSESTVRKGPEQNRVPAEPSNSYEPNRDPGQQFAGDNRGIQPQALPVRNSGNETDYNLSRPLPPLPSQQNSNFGQPNPGQPGILSADNGTQFASSVPPNPSPPNNPAPQTSYGIRPPAAEILPVNTKRFRLNYSIDAIDPSGVQRVDLWVTRDGGQTWEPWGTDPDNVSPFPVEVLEPGLYAFRIVVHSRDGLTGQPPTRGDQPDMWVEVDVDAPRVRITSVPYGQGNEAGRLIINWTAEDYQLTLRPVTLQYSIHPDGPWTTIEKGLRNTGRYVWKPGPEVPERLILKIEARDIAGNIGVFHLNDLLDVSGLVPRGHIHGIEPVGK